VDRDFADRSALVAPHLPFVVRTQRAMLRRMVRYLVGQGVRQFLDLGAGIPATGHVHQIAQAIDPACRIVYVDTDPAVVAAAAEVLAGNERATLVEADIRAPS
jgi:16S rRNA C1402 N4-methylase RsmH